jgi:hypothetical protein
MYAINGPAINVQTGIDARKLNLARKMFPIKNDNGNAIIIEIISHFV